VKKKVKRQYEESLLDDVVRLQKYAWVCKHLRNYIHDGILNAVPQPGRQYGNATNVALMLGGIPDFAPEAGNLDQDHYDDLGVWLADPLTPFGLLRYGCRPCTAGFTLMGAALEYVEAFTKLIIRNKPADAIAAAKSTEQAAAQEGSDDAESVETEFPAGPSRFPGLRSGSSGQTEPPLPEKGAVP